MIIKGLYTHPIKSLHPIPLFNQTLTHTGPLHDREFLLIRPASPAEGREQDENMTVSRYGQLCLFMQEFYPKGSSDDNAEGVLVTYNPPENLSPENSENSRESPERAKNGLLLSQERRVLRVPFYPDTEGLEKRKVMMHKTSCMAWDMGDRPYAKFFEKCLGVQVRLLCLEKGSFRTPLGNMAPGSSSPKKKAAEGGGGIFSRLLGFTNGTGTGTGGRHDDQEQQQEKYEITFSDCAPLLITSEWSLDNLSRRFQTPGSTMDITKFRPNIVLGPPHGTGSPSNDADPDDDVISAWDEDYWAELAIYPRDNNPFLNHNHQSNGSSSTSSEDRVNITLTQNCARCRSINVDYATGEFGGANTLLPGARGEEPFKYLMKDRRVDKGMKWNPVFGRYGFMEGRKQVKVFVGDRVEVVRKNTERTFFYWPGLSAEPELAN